MAAARGDIIVMTDADCVVPQEWIAKIIRPIVSEGELVVIGYEKDLTNNYWTKYVQQRDDDLFFRSADGQYINHLDTKNLAIQSSLARTFQFDRALGDLEDFDLFLRLKPHYRIRFLPDLRVGHHHAASAFVMVKRSFSRGFWMAKVCQKHRPQPAAIDEVKIENYSIKNFLLFPFWMAIQFVKRPINESWPLLLAELSWRSGIVWAIVSRID